MFTSNILLIMFLLFTSDKRLYMQNDGTYYEKDSELRYQAKRYLFWALLFDFPQLLLWLVYFVTRFYPDKLGGDVTIFPGYYQLKEEKELADKMDGISSKSL